MKMTAKNAYDATFNVVQQQTGFVPLSGPFQVQTENAPPERKEETKMKTGTFPEPQFKQAPPPPEEKKESDSGVQNIYEPFKPAEKALPAQKPTSKLMEQHLVRGNDMYQNFPNHSYNFNKKVWCYTPLWMSPNYTEEKKESAIPRKPVRHQKVPIFDRIFEDGIDELYRKSLSHVQLRTIFNSKTPIHDFSFGPLQKLQETNDNTRMLRGMGFGMQRKFSSDRKCSYFKAAGFGFIEKFMTNQNKKGLRFLIRMLNKQEQDQEDQLFSLAWDTKFKGLALEATSKDEITRFVGENEQGIPARDEITKHLKFLLRELEQIHKGKIEECFMINQRMFYFCHNQFFFDSLEYFFRKIIANFLFQIQDQTIQGLPVKAAVLKALRTDNIEDYIKEVVLNFQVDGEGIALKILPLLLKIPIDVFVSGEGETQDDCFLKHVQNMAQYNDFELRAKVEKDGEFREFEEINFHTHEPINILLENGSYSLIYKEEKQAKSCGFGKEALDFDSEFQEQVKGFESAS